MTVAVILIVISFGLFIVIRLSYDKKNNPKKRKILSNIMSVALVVATITLVLQGYYSVLDSENTHNPGKNIISDEHNPLIVTAHATEIIDEVDQTSNDSIRIMEVTKESVFEDISNNKLSADELVGRPICTYYKGKVGEVCIFIGKYDENYNWTGKCSICAYKDGELYYSTEDTYENGKAKSYRRASKSTSSDNWVITEKDVMENGQSFGDTYSYIYDSVSSKIDDVNIYNDNLDYKPSVENIYTIDELYEIFKPHIVNHYYGKYDESGSWIDDTGAAYCVKYNNPNSIDCILKGEFEDGIFISGKMYEIVGDNRVVYSLGKFHDSTGKEIKGEADTWDISMDQFKLDIRSEKFADEVFGVIG